MMVPASTEPELESEDDVCGIDTECDQSKLYKGQHGHVDVITSSSFHPEGSHKSALQ